VEGERGKVFGWTALASGGGGLLAGSIAGPIADRWGFPVLFVVMAATIALMLAIAAFIQDKASLRDVAPLHTKQREPTGKHRSIGYLVVILLVAHLLVRLGQLIGGLGSPLAMTRLGFEAAEVTSAIAVSSAVTLPLPLILGWLSDKTGRKGFLISCYALGALGLFVLIPAVWLWQFWLSATLIAISNSANGVAQAFIADLMPPQAMGRGISLFNTTSLLAGIIGLSGGGYAMQILGLNPALLLAGLLPMVAIGLVLRLRRPTPVPQFAPSRGE
jgi:MFS family permease